MNFDEYRPLALRTAKMFDSQHSNLQHAILGLMTEAGEFATEVKRRFAYGKPMTDEMQAHMREELGDICWYVPLALYALGKDALPALSDGVRAEFADMTLVDTTVTLGAMVGGIATSQLVDEVELEGNTFMLAVIVYLVDELALLIGTTGDIVRAENIAKLRKRFPEAYSDAAAEARADKGGVDARNS